jgi:hypothetical protein
MEDLSSWETREDADAEVCGPSLRSRLRTRKSDSRKRCGFVVSVGILGSAIGARVTDRGRPDEITTTVSAVGSSAKDRERRWGDVVSWRSRGYLITHSCLLNWRISSRIDFVEPIARTRLYHG